MQHPRLSPRNDATSSGELIVHLIDGTYELFRHFYGLRRFNKGEDRPFGAVIGVLHTVLQMIETGATHVGVATDHVIESFRNRVWSGYKTGFGIEPALLAQFHPLEEALAAMGVAVWPMIELEADDALASAAAIAARDEAVEKICIWTPDKDLAQCVVGERVVQVDRKSGKIRGAAGVQEKVGRLPASNPDYLALDRERLNPAPPPPVSRGRGAHDQRRVARLRTGRHCGHPAHPLHRQHLRRPNDPAAGRRRAGAALGLAVAHAVGGDRLRPSAELAP